MFVPSSVPVLTTASRGRSSRSTGRSSRRSPSDAHNSSSSSRSTPGQSSTTRTSARRSQSRRSSGNTARKMRTDRSRGASRTTTVRSRRRSSETTASPSTAPAHPRQKIFLQRSSRFRGRYGYIDPDGVKREYTYETGNVCDPNKRDQEEEDEVEGENGPREGPYVDYQENQMILPNGQRISLNALKNKARRPIYTN